MKIGFTDGEMSNLNADFGQLLCACITPFNPANPDKPWGQIETYTLADYKSHRWNDRSLAIQWRDALEKYDVVVGWNSVKFDIPFLQARLRRWGLRPVRLKRHKDLLYTSRYKLKLAFNSLDHVSDHLQLERKYGVKKTKMEAERWVMAMGGHTPSYNYIITHCKKDVQVLACTWAELIDLVGEIK